MIGGRCIFPPLVKGEAKKAVAWGGLKEEVQDIRACREQQAHHQNPFDESRGHEFLQPRPAVHAREAADPEEKAQEPVRGDNRAGVVEGKNPIKAPRPWR